MHIGLIGLGTMGGNLARNAAHKKATVAIYNRTTEKTDAFMKAHASEGNFIACKTLPDLIKALPTPRAIILMVKAGDAVSHIIDELTPLLETGDMLIDAGNSHDSDTTKRQGLLQKQGIHFLGMGVSGGEEGALHGPSMMPGGSKEAYDFLIPLLQEMAADDGEGGKCVTYIGANGTGHFVKMVHNGIEYGIMQLLAEAYDLLRLEAGLTNEQMADIFEEWNKTDMLSSFLVEITVSILRKKDPETGAFLLDVIKDAAGQKGTGKWTTNAALDYGVSVPTITAAVDARIISSGKDFRIQQGKESPLTVAPKKEIPDLVARIKVALELSIMNAYAQGFQLIDAYNREHAANISFAEVARIWRGGCIIRSSLLIQFQRSFEGDPKAFEWLKQQFAGEAQLFWRSIVALGAERGIPIPAMSASLSYYDGYRTARLPQNLTQAQRDFFGAHTYERLDKPGIFHTEWQEKE